MTKFIISIHAPRKGSDGKRQRKSRRNQHFNPRPPQGERLKCSLIFIFFL